MNLTYIPAIFFVFAAIFLSACGSSDDSIDPVYYGDINIVNAVGDESTVKVYADNSQKTSIDGKQSFAFRLNARSYTLDFYAQTLDGDTSDTDTTSSEPVFSSRISVPKQARSHYALVGPNLDDLELVSLSLSKDSAADGTFITQVYNLASSTIPLNLYLEDDCNTPTYSNPTTLIYKQAVELQSAKNNYCIIITDASDPNNTPLFVSSQTKAYESSGLAWLILPDNGSNYAMTVATYTTAGVNLWDKGNASIRYLSLVSQSADSSAPQRTYPDTDIYMGKTRDTVRCTIDETSGLLPSSCNGCMEIPEDGKYCLTTVDALVQTAIPYGQVSGYSNDYKGYYTLKSVRSSDQSVLFKENFEYDKGQFYTFLAVTRISTSPLTQDSIYRKIYPEDHRSFTDYARIYFTNAYFFIDNEVDVLLEKFDSADGGKFLPAEEYSSYYFLTSLSWNLEAGTYRISFVDGNGNSSNSHDIAGTAHTFTVVNGQNQHLIISESKTGEAQWITLDW